MNNPFTLVFGKNPEQAIARPVQLGEVIETFDSDKPSQQVFMITGIRGSGKTVMLTEIAEYYRKRPEWIVIDLNPNDDLLTGFLAKLSADNFCLELIKNAKINISVMGLGIEIGNAGQIIDAETAIERMLEKLAEKGKKVLITIDEVTSNVSMHKFAGAMQIFIRHNHPVYLVMTGLYENIEELQNEKNLTFLYRASKIYLKSLNMNAIARKYQEVFSLEKEEASEMAQMTQGYPFAFQVLGYLTYNQNGNYREIQNDYRQYLEDYVYDKIWSELSEKDKLVAKAIAQEKTGKVIEIRKRLDMDTNSFNPYRKRLIRKGIVDGSDRGIVKFVLPLFSEYVLDNI